MRAKKLAPEFEDAAALTLGVILGEEEKARLALMAAVLMLLADHTTGDVYPSDVAELAHYIRTGQLPFDHATTQTIEEEEGPQ